MSNETVVPLFTPEQEEYLKVIMKGADSSFTLTAASFIFFMQAGFILVECAAIKRSHYSDVVVKNILDSITGALGFWLAGFGIAFSKTDESGFFGMNPNFYATKALGDYKDENLWLKWFF